MNVTWRLASIVKGLSPMSLLDTYEQERIPVIREMLRMTSNLAQLVFKEGDEAGGAWHRPLSGRQLGVHYRWSSIVLDELKGEGEPGCETADRSVVRRHLSCHAPSPAVYCRSRLGRITTTTPGTPSS